MQADLLLHQRSAQNVNLARLSYRAGTHEVPIKARHACFDGLTIGLHWVTVLLVIALFASAWLHAVAEAQHSGFTPALLQIHRSLGVTVWLITAMRLVWRLTKARMPPFLSGMTRLHRATVKCSEYVLYALLLAQPSTGLLTTLLSGRPFALYAWQFPALVRHDMLRAVFHQSHELGAWALAALTLSHAAAALFHHFVLRDDVLERMAPIMRRRRHKREFATDKIVLPATPSGNKADPLAV